jgi:hypothetical protein
MKSKPKLFILMFIPILFFLSCEKELDIQIPYEGDEYVIYGELPLAEPVSIYVTKTSAVNGVLDFEVALEDLTVLLYENEMVIDTLELTEHNYFRSDYRIKTKLGNQYHIDIFNKANTLIAATQSQTPSKLLENISFTVKPESIKSSNVGIDARELFISIKDEDAADNFYSFNMRAYSSGKRSSITTFVIGKNPDIKDNCGFFFREGYTFTDKCFINEIGVISHGVELRSYDSIRDVVRIPDSVVVTFKTIDKYYYDYFASITEVSLFENAFVAPQPLKSNMRKGLGIWSPVNTQRFTYIPSQEN